jgi:hypothetical protein
MLARLIVPVLAAAALTSCASHDSAPAPSIGNGGAAMSTSAPPGPVGFLGADGLQATATPEINHALDTAIKGQPLSWTDTESGAVVQFTALDLSQLPDNSYCRTFSQTVTNGSKTETVRGKACQTTDGTWRAVAG